MDGVQSITIVNYTLVCDRDNTVTKSLATKFLLAEIQMVKLLIQGLNPFLELVGLMSFLYPVWNQSLGIQSLRIQSLGIQSLGIQSLGIQSLGIQSLGIQSLGIQSLGIQSPWFQSLGIQSLGIQSLGIQSLGIQSLEIQSLGFKSDGFWLVVTALLGILIGW